MVDTTGPRTTSTAGPRRTPRRTLSTRKKAFYAILVTCCFFLCVETLLAALGVQSTLDQSDPFVGFESSVPLFSESSAQGETLIHTTENKLRFFNFQQFPKEKGANTVRIFCLGGSTTFGRPYDDRTSYVAWLREMLPLVDPQRHWEVVNVGGISYASYRLAATMDELLQYSPDLFLIYTGHNEFLEERTYRDLNESSRGVRRATAALLRSRTGSLAFRLLGPHQAMMGSSAVLPAEVDTILDHSVGPEAYQRNDRLKVDILNHFAFNLDRMAETGREAGAKVMFVKPASNQKDFSPFKSQFARTLSDDERQRWVNHVESARELETEGKTAVALEQLRLAANIDDGRADLHFQIARLLQGQGEWDQAREHFQRAIDQDVCPLRATSEIQQLIEQTAVVHQVPLVDFDSILRNDCWASYGHRSPGREYFLDHVHPTIESHRLLALAVVEAMTLTGMVTQDSMWDDEAIQLVSYRIESRIDTELQAHALTNLSQVLGWAGKKEEAGRLAIEAVRIRSAASLAEDPESMLYAAVSHAVNGHDSEAIELLRRVVELEPANVQARWRLAALLYDQAQFQEAVIHFRVAVELDPNDASSFQMLGSALQELGRHEAALEAWTRAAKLEPNNDSVRQSIESLRNRQLPAAS